MVATRNKAKENTYWTPFSSAAATSGAGTSKHAKHTVSVKDIAWADLIAVMEHKHKQAIQEKFAKELKHKKIIILDIPDDYQYMDAELVEMLQLSMTPYLPE